MNRKGVVFVYLLMTISMTSMSQSELEVKKYVKEFLSTHDSRVDSDSLPITDSIYHVILLQRVKSAKLSIYKFGFNYVHASTNYILVVDNVKKSWTVYGQNEIAKDVKQITMFFYTTKRIKRKVIIQCYQFLIDNDVHRGVQWKEVKIE